MTIEPIGGYSIQTQNQSTGNDSFALAQSLRAQESAPMDKQTFGAAVVTKTMDYLNGQGSSGTDAAPMDKQTFGAAVVSKTLDYMNSGQGHDSGMAQSYDFQKSVLGGHADEIGALTNIKI